jgi:hypothetical protein
MHPFGLLAGEGLESGCRAEYFEQSEEADHLLHTGFGDQPAHRLLGSLARLGRKGNAPGRLIQQTASAQPSRIARADLRQRNHA